MCKKVIKVFSKFKKGDTRILSWLKLVIFLLQFLRECYVDLCTKFTLLFFRYHVVVYNCSLGDHWDALEENILYSILLCRVRFYNNNRRTHKEQGRTVLVVAKCVTWWLTIDSFSYCRIPKRLLLTTKCHNLCLMHSSNNTVSISRKKYRYTYTW